MLKVLGIIPARGGSKGIPHKNIKLLGGKPLIGHSIDAAKAARHLNRLVVSTEDEEIGSIARSYGAAVISRPLELARDDTPTLQVLQHIYAVMLADGYACDAVMTLQPTSPFRTSENIDESIEAMTRDRQADSLVSCVQVPHIFSPASVMTLSGDGYLQPFATGPLITRRQDKQILYARNGAAIYITRAERLADYVFGGRILPYFMKIESSVDIDTMEDWEQAEAILERRCRLK